MCVYNQFPIFYSITFSQDSLKRPTADELLNSNTMQLLSQIENENDEIEKNNLML